jgi:hypothetical protein
MTVVEAAQEGIDFGQGSEFFWMIQGVLLVAVSHAENGVVCDTQIEVECACSVLEVLV